MDATRIIAIRHGETSWNATGRIQGHTDIPLNATGQAQAQQAAQALADETLAAIYSSDLQRAWQTAQALATTTQTALYPEPGLRERCFGVFEGRTFAEVAQSHPEDSHRWRKRDPHLVFPGGGESLLQLRERIAATVQRLAQQHVGEQIALIAHGGVMDILYRLATQQDLQAPRTWVLTNTAINRLLWTPQGLSLVDWGGVRRLASGALQESISWRPPLVLWPRLRPSHKKSQPIRLAGCWQGAITAQECAVFDPGKSCPGGSAWACWPQKSPGIYWHRHRIFSRWRSRCHRAPRRGTGLRARGG